MSNCRFGQAMRPVTAMAGLVPVGSGSQGVGSRGVGSRGSGSRRIQGLAWFAGKVGPE
jgi:hypothetical protein